MLFGPVGLRRLKVVTRSRETGIGFFIGLLGTAALPFLVGTIVDTVNGPGPEGGARRTKAIADVMAIEQALALFARDQARPPSQQEGLAALIPTYLDRMPVDPWGNEYVYAPNSNNGPVTSYGADGKPGGEGAASDVTHQDVTRRFDRERSSLQTISDAAGENMLFASVLLISMIAYLATDRPAWSVGVLAGVAAFFALLPLGIAAVALRSAALGASLVLLGIGVVFAVESTAVLLRVRYSDGVTMTTMLLLVGGLWMLLPRIIR